MTTKSSSESNGIRANNNVIITNNRQSFNSSDDVVVTESRYGCYKFGAIVAIAIILILLIGTVPILFTIKDRTIILLITCIVLVIVGALVIATILCQQRQARNQRQSMGRDTIRRQKVVYTSVPLSTATHHTSWSFWSSKKNNYLDNSRYKLDSSGDGHRQRSILV